MAKLPPNLPDDHAVLGRLKVRPVDGSARIESRTTADLDPPCARRRSFGAGRDERKASVEQAKCREGRW